MNNDNYVQRKVNPRRKANCLSVLLFLHIFPIFWSSYKHGLKEEDLFEPLDEHKSKTLGDKLEEDYKKRAKKNKKWALHLALLHVFGKELLLSGICFLLSAMITINFLPFVIGKIVLYFSENQSVAFESDLYIYAALLLVLLLTDRLSIHPAMMWIMHIAMKMRIACSAVIYRKTLRITRSALSQTTVGHVVNLLSNDLSKFDQGFVLVHWAWLAPLQCILGTYYLYDSMGIAGFVGIGLLISFIPIQLWIGKRTSALRLKIALTTDERVRLMNEIISGMQVIKMYTWEKPFANLISHIRRKEMKLMRSHKYLISIIYSLETFGTRLAIFLTLYAHVMLGYSITAEAVFKITAIFNILRTSTSYLFSISISSIAEVHISVRRINNFLRFDELPLESIEYVESPEVKLKDVTANWMDESNDDSLKDISVDVTSKQIVAIVGLVGSGKSTLLNVLLKELPIKAGKLQIAGRISFCSQESWLFSGTVRQNILFCNAFDEQRYKEVCRVCALEQDFMLMSNGDSTMVGDKGVTLSGGQKARINLARCIYKEADIYLLDDPLSAVDANVGKQIYNQCIKSYLKEKLRIFVTHQLHYLKNVDNIILLKDGVAVAQGNYDELQSSGLDFTSFMKKLEDEHTDNERRMSKQSNTSESKELIYDYESYENEANNDANKEQMESGKITGRTYMDYIKTGGNWLIIGLLGMSFIISQISLNAGDYYVSYWVNVESNFTDTNSTTILEEYSDIRYNIIYQFAGIIAFTVFIAVAHTIWFFIFFVNASINLHDIIFDKLAYTKMHFFHTNPIGRILNRFSKDLGIIDEYIPLVIYDVVEVALLLLGTIILTSSVSPLLIIPAVILIIIFYLIRIIYLRTSRSVKRIEGIARSPIFGHITATINGLNTIRSFQAQDILIKEFDKLQDMHSSAWYIYLASNRAFGLWLDLICVVFIGIIVAIVFLMDSGLYSGYLGLIITQYIGIMGSLQWGMRQWSELENQMTSVERVVEYTRLEKEPERSDKLEKELNADWSRNGKVEFRNVSLKYNQNEPAVINNLNFVIQAKEKVGIVGRTGAGKSSLISAFFQLYECEGDILIDNVAIRELPIDFVRSRISIIPQEPVLFSGSLRKNLDPFDEFNDDVIWNALEQVELKANIAELSNTLHTNVSEGGSNFSVGQRQLICLARAILRNNKILIMDEATANVDLYTDALIQRTIRHKFFDCTVLTIAHRLNTILDSDKILVMDAGRAIEFDTPNKLFQNKKSVFRKMLGKAGLVIDSED